jgi:hypothetical protein
MSVAFDAENLYVDLADGRRIAAPLAWYPRLAAATSEQLSRWTISGAGFGIHWAELDEDLSAEGLLRQAPSPTLRKLQR